MQINLVSRLLDEHLISENVSQKFKGDPIWETYYHGEAVAIDFVMSLIQDKVFEPHIRIEEQKRHYTAICDYAKKTNRLEYPGARNAAGWLSGLSIAERIMRVWER